MTWWRRNLTTKHLPDVNLRAQDNMSNVGFQRAMQSTFVRSTVGFVLGYFETDNAGAVLRTIKLAPNVRPIEGARYNVSDIDTEATVMYNTFADGSAIDAKTLIYRGQRASMNWCDRSPHDLHAHTYNSYLTASTVVDPTSPTGYATSAVVSPDTNDEWWGSLNIHVWNVFENYFMADTDVYVSAWAKGDGVNTLELEDLKYNTALNDLQAVYCNGEVITTSTTITPSSIWRRYDFKFRFSATDYNNARIGYRFRPCVTDQDNGTIKITGVNITDVPFATTSTVPSLQTAANELRIPNNPNAEQTLRAEVDVSDLPIGVHCYFCEGISIISIIRGTTTHQVATIDSARADGASRVIRPTADKFRFSISVTATTGRLVCNGEILTWARNGDVRGVLGTELSYMIGFTRQSWDSTNINQAQLLNHASDDATELAWTQGGN